MDNISSYIKALKLISQIKCEAFSSHEFHIIEKHIDNWEFDRYIRFKGDIYPIIQNYQKLKNRQTPILNIAHQKLLVEYIQNILFSFFQLDTQIESVLIFGSYCYSPSTYFVSEIDCIVKIKTSNIFHDGIQISCENSIITNIFGENISYIGLIIISSDAYDSSILNSEIEATMLMEGGTGINLIGKQSLLRSPLCNYLYHTKRLMFNIESLNDDKKKIRLNEIENILHYLITHFPNLSDIENFYTIEDTKIRMINVKSTINKLEKEIKKKAKNLLCLKMPTL